MTASAVALAGQLSLGAGPAIAATCQTSAGPTSYSVTVCLTSPADAAVLTGTRDVTATVFVDPGSTVGVDRVVFSWNGGYLLADHFADYRMTFRSSRLPDSTGFLEARAVMTDGFTTPTTAVTVTLSNPTSAPPGTEQFTPRLGSALGPGERFRIAAVGDGVDGSPAAVGVADLIDSWDPDVFAYLGDVYDRGSAYEFDTWYGDLSGYGRFRAITNPAIGNHEYMTDHVDAAPYFEFWGNVPHYYSYDVGGWHVVVLDSTVEFDQLVPGTPQYDWLAADLMANQGRCTLTYLHHPRYTGVANVGRVALSQVWSLLVERGVTLMLAGHAHTYERWTPMDGSGSPDPGGMTQFVAGTGGRGILNPKVPDSRVLADFTLPGALRLDLGAQDADFAFVGADGVVRDSGTVPCRKPLAVTPAPTSPTPTRPDTVAPTTPGGATASAATTRFPQRSGRALLRQLRRAPEHRAGYTSARFPSWTDADGDRCDTAAEVLVEEAVRPPAVAAPCVLTGGRWFSPYDGVPRTRAGRLLVDHSGVAAKGGREPQKWMPRKAYRCSYAAEWVADKRRWHLAVDPAERRFLVRTLSSCRWPTVRAASRPRIVASA